MTRGLLAAVLPPEVVAVEVRGDLAGARPLGGEEALVRGAAASRRQEFATTRHCARVALAELGVPAGPLLRGPRRAPAWPAGTTGSLTHCRGYRGAAVASAPPLRALGVDAEPHQPLPAGLLERCASPGEAAQVAALARRDPSRRWDRLLWCAKEAVLKTWPPDAPWPGVPGVRVVLAADGTFLAQLPGAGSAPGRWAVGEGLVLTAVALRAPGSSAPARPSGTTRCT